MDRNYSIAKRNLRFTHYLIKSTVVEEQSMKGNEVYRNEVK